MLKGIILHGTDAAPFLEMISDLRCYCWKGGLPDLNLLNDGHDDHAIHFLIYRERAAIAAARLCVHERISDVPDPHLYTKISSTYSHPFGCMNRLVVHPEYRGIGISAVLDHVRAETAQSYGCKTMLGAWNEHTIERRRQALNAQGFTTVSNSEPVADGKWGNSYPYARRLNTTIGNCDERHNAVIELDSLLFKLNGLQAELNSGSFWGSSADEA